MQVESPEARMMKRSRFASTWKLLPTTVRKTIVLVIGSTLILTGMLLIVLPGPFTLPLVILGLVVLALEFAWLNVLLKKSKLRVPK
jgi:hypothetical protein